MIQITTYIFDSSQCNVEFIHIEFNLSYSFTEDIVVAAYNFHHHNIYIRICAMYEYMMFFIWVVVLLQLSNGTELTNNTTGKQKQKMYTAVCVFLVTRIASCSAQTSPYKHIYHQYPPYSKIIVQFKTKANDSIVQHIFV